MTWVKAQQCWPFFVVCHLCFPRESSNPGNLHCLPGLLGTTSSSVLYLSPHFKFSCWWAQGKCRVSSSPCLDQLHIKNSLEGTSKLKRERWTVISNLAVEIPTVTFVSWVGQSTAFRAHDLTCWWSQRAWSQRFQLEFLVRLTQCDWVQSRECSHFSCVLYIHLAIVLGCFPSRCVLFAEAIPYYLVLTYSIHEGVVDFQMSDEPWS